MIRKIAGSRSVSRGIGGGWRNARSEPCEPLMRGASLACARGVCVGPDGHEYADPRKQLKSGSLSCTFGVETGSSSEPSELDEL